MSGQAKRKRITAAQRMEIWKKYGGRCAYCGCKIQLKEMQVDHVEAIYRHEKEYIESKAKYLDDMENYMPACRMCNFYKMTYTRIAKKYGMILEQKKEIVFYFEKAETEIEQEQKRSFWIFSPELVVSGKEWKPLGMNA